MRATRPALITAATALLLAACDGRPLLYQLSPSQTDIECLQVFQMIDTANKGQLTRAEIDAYFNRRFTELDRNHDNFLDPSEAAGAVPIFGFKTASALIFSLDFNSDGKLSPEEFLKLSNYLLTRDYNHDGILTLAEVKIPPSDDYMAPREQKAAVETIRSGR